MPWTKNQIDAATLALAAKEGKFDVSKLRHGAKSMYDSMTADELREFISEGVKK